MHGISFRRSQRIQCIHSPKRPTLRPTRYTYEEVSPADQGIESGGPEKVPIPKRPPSAARIAITDITSRDDSFDSMLVCRVGDWMSTSAERYSSTPTKAELGITSPRGSEAEEIKSCLAKYTLPIKVQSDYRIESVTARSRYRDADTLL
jgi:hypothetical protein